MAGLNLLHFYSSPKPNFTSSCLAIWALRLASHNCPFLHNITQISEGVSPAGTLVEEPALYILQGGVGFGVLLSFVCYFCLFLFVRKTPSLRDEYIFRYIIKMIHFHFFLCLLISSPILYIIPLQLKIFLF